MISATLYGGWYVGRQFWSDGNGAGCGVDGRHASVSSTYRFWGMGRAEDSIGRGEVRHSHASTPEHASSCYLTFLVTGQGV